MLRSDELWYEAVRGLSNRAVNKAVQQARTGTTQHRYTYAHTSSFEPEQEPVGEISNIGSVPQKACLNPGTLAELTRQWGYAADSFLLWNVPANKGNDDCMDGSHVTIHRKRKTLHVCSFCDGRPMKDPLSRVESGLPSSIASGADGVFRAFIVRACTVVRSLRS